MRFALMVDLGRTTPELSMEENLAQILEIVQTAEDCGFEMVFVGEHHGHEMTIAPGPFTLLTYLSQHTRHVRLGTAVLCAPYWHPVRLAGEAALFDLISGGRLELGLGRGAYPYEFSRMAGGIPPEVAREQLGELVPALRGLWRGDYAHDGTMWKFPETTSTPRPRTPEGPPLWIAARHPDGFRMAVENRAHLMVNPLGQGIEEVRSLQERRLAALRESDSAFEPQMMVLRSTFAAASAATVDVAVDAYIHDSGYFDNLFATDGEVKNGWVAFRDPRVHGAPEKSDRELIKRNQMFGTVEEILPRLREYEETGTDVYLYKVMDGLPHAASLESVRRFGEDVIPRYRNEYSDAA